MSDLPPEFEALAALVDAEPSPVREAFQYCLCLMMVEAGKMRLVETIPGESAPLYLFESIDGDTFSIPKPDIEPEQEAALIAVLREILADEGWV